MYLPNTLAELELITEKLRPSRNQKKTGLSGCWTYTHHRNDGGFAVFRLPDGTTILAAKRALELAGRPVRDGHVVIRKCRNVFCCNPDHLDDIPKWYADTVFKKNAEKAMARERQRQQNQTDLKLP